MSRPPLLPFPGADAEMLHGVDYLYNLFNSFIIDSVLEYRSEALLAVEQAQQIARFMSNNKDGDFCTVRHRNILNHLAAASWIIERARNELKLGGYSFPLRTKYREAFLAGIEAVGVSCAAEH